MTSEEVSAWLEPLFAGAEHHPDIDLWALVKQATHPVSEVLEPEVADWLGGRPDVPDITLVVDWTSPAPCGGSACRRPSRSQWSARPRMAS